MPLNIRFTGYNCENLNASYPEGNFGRNQLLDGSISLSPLNACLTIDLHVRTATNFHQGFPWLHSTHIKFTIFRVSLHILLLSSLPTAIEPVSVAFIVMICTRWQKSHFKHCKNVLYFHFEQGFSYSRTLAHAVNSLDRVSRRVE